MSNTTITPSPAALGVEQQSYATPTTGSVAMSGSAGGSFVGSVAAPLAAALALAVFAPLIVGVTSPGSGSLGLQGSTPTVQSSGAKVLVPGAGAMVVTTHNQSPSIAPSSGVLVIAGQARVSNAFATPGTAILRMTLQGIGGTLTPAVGSLALSGSAPTQANITISPSAGGVVLSGLVAAQILTVAPASIGQLVLGGVAPSVTISANVIIAPNAAAIVATGFSPFSARGLSPQSGVVSMAGAAPRLASFDVIPQGALALTGAAPIPVFGTVITPTWATVTATGVVPAVFSMITPPTAALNFTPAPPTFFYGPIIVTATGTLTAASSAAAVFTPQLVQPSGTALALTGGGGVLNTGLTPSSAALQLSGMTGIVTERTNVASGALSLASSSPVLALTMTPPAGQLALSSASVIAVTNDIVIPPGAALAAVSVAVSVTVGVSPLPTASGLVLNGYAPQLSQTFNGVALPISGSVGFAGVPAHTLQTVPSTAIFTDIVLLRAPVAGASLQGGPLPYGAAYQAVGEQIPYGIDWEDWLALRWQPGTLVSQGQVVRPTISNGYEFLCVTAGETGSVEPGWPPFLGSTVLDGSAQWQCQALASDSLETTIADINWTADPALSLSGNVLAAQTSIITVDSTNAVAGVDYALKCMALMSDGQRKVGTIIVKVR